MGCVEDYKEAAMKAARFIIKDDPANDPNAVLADAPAGKEFKFDDSKVLIEQHLAPIFSDKNMKIQADVIDTIMDLMGPLGKKIKHLKGLDISEVSDYANAVKDPSKIVPYNIALKELLDTQKSEHDKMLKTNGIDTIEKISDDGVMNVGLARSASVIGRRYAYTLGYRFKSNPDENQRLSALSIEKLYHNLGMDILQNMQNDGLVELTKGQIINDFIKEGDVKRSYAPGDLVIKTDIARLNLDKLFSESDYKENGDLYKAVLRGNKKLRKDSDAKSLNVVNAIVNGINLAKIPSTIALPLTEKSEIHDTNDAITTSPAAEEARTLISETPVEINENVIPYIKDLASKWKKSKLTFTHFIEDYAESDLETLNSMFGINPSHLYSDEIEDSVQGQNRSKYTALEELLNNIEEFTDGNKAIELYTNYSYVRNARFNMDNTVLNGVSSKYVRYMVTSGESTVDITPENESLIKHTIDAILDQKDSLGADTMYKKRSTNGDGAIAWKSTKGLEEGSKEYIAADQHNYDLIAGFVKDPILENYLEAYRDGVKSTGREQTESYSNIISDGNFMAALDTLGAISDYRDALQSKTPMKTRFNTKSDATASGGSITTATSVGYSQKAISVMEQLGFLKGGKADLNDIYGLLEDRLNKVVSGEAKDRSGKKKKTDLEEFLKVVYRGKMRDLSKDPTMTFVYNQQETGAIQTIAETVTEKLIKSIGDSTINEETNKTYGEETGMYIAKLLKLQDPIITYEMLFSRENIKKDLITALSKKSGIITFIHKELELAVNPIIEERKSTILSLYKEANKLFKNNVKILPAIAKFSTDTGSAIESTIENIYKNKYGMPLTKLQNILHPAKGDGQVDLVTIKEMANETTSVVNTTHGQDNAIGSLATIRAVKRFKAMYPRENVPGVTWVHDEFITAPKLGKLIEEEYIKAFPKVVANYSVEEELMRLVLEKDPTNKVALGLKPKIEEAISTKKALMKNFTAESGKVYGNKVGTYDLRLGKSTPPTDGGKKSNNKPKYTTTPTATSIPNGVDAELHSKLDNLLKSVYTDIDSGYVKEDLQYVDNNGNVMNQKEYNLKVDFSLKVVKALEGLAIAKPSKHGGASSPVMSTIRLSHEAGIRKKLSALGVPSIQVDFVFDYMKENNLKEVKTYDLAIDILAKHSETVEMSITSSGSSALVNRLKASASKFLTQKLLLQEQRLELRLARQDTSTFDKEIAFLTDHIDSLNIKIEKAENTSVNSEYYKDLTVPGGKNYVELEISTPNTKVEKGHPDFATDNGVGWFRSDESTDSDGVVRVLEMQSDLFQEYKGKQLTEDEVENTSPSKGIHQLLNTKNAWVSFFIKSMVSDSVKEGYSKVLFPTADTIHKIEGYAQHTATRENIYRTNKVVQNKVDKLNSKGEALWLAGDKVQAQKLYKEARILKSTMKQETENISYNVRDFYQVRVKDTINKLYPGRVKEVTDSHGNSWFELTLDPKTDSSTIMLQRDGSRRIKGQADIEAKTVLIDERIMTQDTLPHEYAHHYIAMFRDAPIVQDAIKKWGSEEKLVQAIGEQVVEQKGEVYGWWKSFTKWIKDQFKATDAATKEELRNLLTDAFLENKEIGARRDTTKDKVKYQIKEEPYPDDFDPSKNYIGVKATAPEVIIGKSAHMLNQMSKNLLIDNVERLSTNFIGTMDRFLDIHFPMYADARRRVLGLYNDSAASAGLQQLGHYMSLSSFKGKTVKQMFLSKYHNMKEERNAMEHKQISTIHDFTKDFSEEGKKELYDLVTKVPIHNFFLNDAELTSKKAVEKRIAELEGSLTSHMDTVNDTVSLIVDKEVKPNSIYNMADKYGPGPTATKVELLITLKSMQKAGLIDSVFNLQTNHTPLYQTMKDNSMALYAITNKLHGMSPKGHLVNHQMVTENFGGRKQFKPITLKDRNLYEVEGLNGWKIIKEPTETSVGVVVKAIRDETFNEGSGLSNDLPSHDILVPSHMVENLDPIKSNIIEVDGYYKLILSREEKLKAGLVTDMGTVLVKSASNAIIADDSTYLQSKLLENDLRGVLTSTSDKEVDNVVDKISDKVVDHPWVLKLEDGVKFDELPKVIQQKYKPLAQKLTTLQGFDKEVTHVRKDIEHWLVGGHMKSLFTNPTIQRYSEITKELIAGSKIGMIMVNPAKLTMDSMSNNVQLSLLGVPLTKTAKYTQTILKSVDSFNKIKNAMYEAKLLYKANPTEGRKKRYESLQRKLKQNDLFTAYDNGFMSSLSSDILNSNVDTTEGLQADIHKSLKYLLTDKNGEKNTLHEIIGSASRFGMDGGHILNSIGAIVSNFNSDKEVENYLRGVTENIRKIKRDDDMVKYLAQFTTSPDAETVKAGTWLNDFMDMSMREVYRRHLIDTGVDPKKAIEKAVAMSPFYPEDMPLWLKVLSNYFLTPFISFGARVVQPVAYVARNRSVPFAIEEYLGLESFLSAHPMHKVLEGTLGSQPQAAMGVGSVLPINIFNFGQ